MFTRGSSKVAAVPAPMDGKSPPRGLIPASLALKSPKSTPTVSNDDMEALKKEVKKTLKLVITLQQTLSNVASDLESEKQKNATSEQVIADLRAELKAKGEALAKVEKFCEQMPPYIKKQFAEAERGLATMIDAKFAEHMGDKEAIAKIDHKVAVLQSQVNVVETSLCKDLNVEGEIASLKDDQRGNVGEFENIRQRVEKVENTTREMQAQMGTPYRDAVNRSVGSFSRADSKAPTSGHSMYAASKASQENKCVIKAPKGMFQGRSSTARAEDFNKTVLAKLVMKEGHFSWPEATNMARLGGKEGADRERWVVYFKSPSDVSKLFEYKKQFKNVCPQVYVEPYLTKEEMAQRNLLWVGARQFISQQAMPKEWNFQWIENVKGIITGPAGARRYVIMDGERAKVTDGGDVRFVRARDRKPAAKKDE
jgi:hypothetical protein